MAKRRKPSKSDLAEVARGKGSARDRAEAMAFSRSKKRKVRRKGDGPTKRSR